MSNRELVFTGVLSRDIDRVWPKVEKQIFEAYQRARGRLNIQDVYDLLKTSDMQLWLALEGEEILGLCTTEIVRYPRKKVCAVRMCTGKDYNKWKHFIKNIEDWARISGCTAMETQCRQGWARVFKDYEQTHVFLEKDL